MEPIIRSNLFYSLLYFSGYLPEEKEIIETVDIIESFLTHIALHINSWL